MSVIPAGLGLITFGVWEALLVFGILVLLFGARKLPALARGLGSGIRNFKGELKAGAEEAEEEEGEEVERTP